jgi:hypothetical protein
MLTWGGGNFTCPAAGGGGPYPSGYHTTQSSFNYTLTHNAGSGEGWQKGWVYCNLCGGLYFQSERARSVCSVNGYFGHEASGSYAYQLIF